MVSNFMKTIACLAIAVLLGCSEYTVQPFRLSGVTDLVRVFEDGYNLPASHDTISVFGISGEVISAQCVLISKQDLENVSVEVSTLKNQITGSPLPEGVVDWNFVGSVPLSENTPNQPISALSRPAPARYPEIFPDLEVTEISSIADARENQRAMMNKYGAFIIPFIIISCLLITGLLFHQNVSARKKEIGLLKAMGNSSFAIGFMIIFKAFMLGLAGGIIGFFLGSWIAEYFGKEIFSFTALSIKPVWSIFYYTIVIFPLLWMLSSWIPALIATRIDAAKILSDD